MQQYHYKNQTISITKGNHKNNCIFTCIYCVGGKQNYNVYECDGIPDKMLEESIVNNLLNHAKFKINMDIDNNVDVSAQDTRPPVTARQDDIVIEDPADAHLCDSCQ